MASDFSVSVKLLSLSPADAFFSRLRGECDCGYPPLLFSTTRGGDDWHSVAACSDGSYGVENGLISSFPVHVRGRIRSPTTMPIDVYIKRLRNSSVDDSGSYGFWKSCSLCSG